VLLWIGMDVKMNYVFQGRSKYTKILDS